MMNLGAGPDVVAIPGPSVVPERVLSAMHRPMPDIYSGELIDVTSEVFDALPPLARTKSRGFVTISNGHGAWEMALTNTMSKGDRVLILECGRFAAVWGEMATFIGLEVEQITADVGRAIDPDVVEQHLRDDSQHTIKAVLAVQVDTASSVSNDIAALRRAIDSAGHPALFMVDCIASLGCERYEMDEWGVDVTIGASQKGLMTPPGLGFVWAGPRALAVHDQADLRTRYWDWTRRTEEGAHYLRYCGTPPVSHLFGFREALRMISEEGLEARWVRHAALANAVRAAVTAWSTPDGFRLHVTAPEEQSNSVTTIHTGSIDAVAMADVCREQTGVTLGIGIGQFAGTSFRIGHMGYVSAPMVLGVLGTIETVLRHMDAPVGSSGVAAASRALAGSMGDARLGGQV